MPRPPLSFLSMPKPILQNIHMDWILECATPSGVATTIRPGEYVIGEYFLHLTRKGFFEVVEVDISKIKPHLIKYEQR